MSAIHSKPVGPLPEGKSERNGKQFPFRRIMWGCVAAAVVISLILLILYHKDINVRLILRYTPKNLYLAALVFFGLFALKSLSVVFDMRLIYIAAGMVFPLPAALAVNALGTIVEATIPFLEGRAGGGELLRRLLKKWPKLERISMLRIKNGYLYVTLLRLMGMMADPLSMYFGASGLSYAPTVLGCVTGMAPVIVLTTVMGESIRKPGSAAFILSTSLFVLLQVAALLVIAGWLRRSKPSGGGETSEK